MLCLRPKELRFFSTLGNLTQGSSNMRQPKHESLVEISKAQEAMKLCHSHQGWTISNDLDLSLIHMHALIIDYVAQILDLV